SGDDGPGHPARRLQRGGGGQFHGRVRHARCGLAAVLAIVCSTIEMNKFALSPNSLVGVPALEYIDALVQAGYDGIGLRMYASPGVNYESVTVPIAGDPPLMRDV